LAQQPSADPNTPPQGASAQGSSGQNASTRNSTTQDSAKRDSSNQTSSNRNTSNRDSASQDSPKQADTDRDAENEESSSHDIRPDLSPPKDDDKDHPFSKSAVADLEPTPPADTTGLQEFHPWNPLKASKDVEVGDYYFKRKNYKAALERYKEALYYKDNDAIATYRLAVCEEKMGNKDEARKNFEQYLKILPEGPLAKDARASLEKLSEKKSP